MLRQNRNSGLLYVDGKGKGEGQEVIDAIDIWAPAGVLGKIVKLCS